MMARSSAEPAPLEAVLRCPRCQRGALARSSAGWICGTCSAGYPVFGRVPWLFADPQAALAEWRTRLEFLIAESGHEAGILRREAAAAGLLDATRARLAHLAAAHEDHARRLGELLAPFVRGAPPAPRETLLALQTRLPLDQGLANYYANLHRDWVWGAAENAAGLEALAAVVDPGLALGRTLVLGAGAGRLAYDVHRRFAPPLIVAMDFNPLLLAVADTVVHGGTVELYEFPIAPRTLADTAILRRLAAPEAAGPGLHLVGADALRAPFAPGAFDTVLTPWFIDIVPERFDAFATRVNALLRPGGRWLNTGSLAFAQAERALRHGPEETLAIVCRSGFEVTQTGDNVVPYMQSPASRHARMERIFTWCAAKVADVPAPPPYAALPEWLVHPGQPVPLLEDFRNQALATRIQAFLMALVDGRRSVRDIAAALVAQRLMTAEDAESAVRGFLARMYEDSRRRTGF